MTITKEKFFNGINSSIRKNYNLYGDYNMSVSVSFKHNEITDEIHNTITEWLNQYIDIMNEENKFIDVYWYDCSMDDETNYVLEMTDKIIRVLSYATTVSDDSIEVENIEFNSD